MKTFLIILASAFCLNSIHAQKLSHPVIPGDFADPSIIKAWNRFYAVGTSSEWAPHFPIFQSTDLKTWKQSGYVFDKAPDWTMGSFWAPEYFFHNGTYFIYYTARRKSDRISCIGVATSRYPDRGFVDRGIVVDYGKEAIDAFVINEGGQLYISFKAFGLDDRPIELLGSKLSADGLRMEGEVFPMLKDEPRIGMEGQSIIKKDGVFYLFYSAGNCCGSGCSYDVRVARSKNITGPYEYYPANPILSANEFWKCPGHGTFVKSKNDYYYLYHAYNQQSHVFTGRQGMLAKLSWDNTSGWPALSQQPVASAPTIDVIDEFNGSMPAVYWQHDFRNAIPLVQQSAGKLKLSGSVNAGNETGLVLAVRPAHSAFTMETVVTNNNEALKGLTLYGDADASIGIGVKGNKVEYWMVKGKERTVFDMAVVAPGPVSLRMVTDTAHQCRVFYKQSGSWLELKSGKPVDISFLPPWDRSPRAGLHVKGDEGEMGEFERYEVRYGK